MGHTDLWPHGVLDAHDADAGQPGEDVVLAVPVGLAVGGREVPVRQADGPQALRGHGLDHLLHHVVPVPRAEHLGLAAGREDFVAPGGASEREKERDGKRAAGGPAKPPVG